MVTSYRWILDEIPRVHGLRGSTDRLKPDLAPAPTSEDYDLVIHLGVSPNSNGKVAIEHRARRYGYTHEVSDNCREKMPIRDVDANPIDRGFVFDESDVATLIDGVEQLSTDLDIEKVAQALDRDAGFACQTSTDPGNLAYGAIFYASLASAERVRRLGRKPMQVAFVHVPECVDALAIWLIRQGEQALLGG